MGDKKVVEFKVGDKVRYIEGDSNQLTTGGVYTVADTKFNESFGQGIFLEGFPKPFMWWYSYRFELAYEAKPVAEKPPLGIRPRYIADRERLIEILEAMLRYAQAAKVIPDAWDDEYDDLRERLNDHYDPGQFIHTSV